MRLELLLRGRRNTFDSLVIARARLVAAGARLPQHLESLGIARARLVAAGARLLLRGRRSNLCIWSYFCVAGAALGDSGDC